MRVVQFNCDEHEELWSSFVSSFPGASIYHTREWAKILKKTFSFKEKSLMCFDDEKKVVAILPLWKINRNFRVNSPLRDRADLLANSQEAEHEMSQQLLKMNCDLVLKDWNHSVPSDDFFLEGYWITSVLNLTLGKDAVWRKVDKTAQRNIKKAQDCGVRIEQSLTPQAMMEFYKLFKKTRKRLGVPIYPWAFFENILGCLKSNSIRLYIGYLSSKPISGIIILDSPRLSIYAYGASDNRYQSTRVNDLVFWKAISDSIDLGKSHFDFGADSPSQESLIQFKKKWGIHPKILHTLYKRKNRIDFGKNDFSSKRYAVYRRVLSYFPEWILIHLGSFMAKRYG